MKYHFTSLHILLIYISIGFSSFCLASENQSKVISIPDAVDAMSEFSAGARQAGSILLQYGVAALPEIHTVLSDPSASMQQKMQLVTVLGEIGHESSVPVILELAGEHQRGRYLMQNIFLSLSGFSQTDEITSFVDEVLDSRPADPLIIRSALAYYLKKPSDSAKRWAELYTALDASKDVRYVAFYLAGLLGMDDLKAELLIELTDTRKDTRRRYLLLGLAYMTSRDEFDSLVPAKDISRNNQHLIALFYDLEVGDSETRNKTAIKIIQKRENTLLDRAVDRLISEGEADVLASFVYGIMPDSSVKNSLRKKGYQIDIDDKGARLVTYSYSTASRNTIKIDEGKDQYLVIVQTLIDDNKAEFIDHLVRDVDYSQFLIISNPLLKLSKKEDTSQRQFFTKFRENIIRSWIETYDTGVESGLVWSEVKIVSTRDCAYDCAQDVLLRHDDRYVVVRLNANTMLAHTIAKWSDRPMVTSTLRWLGTPTKRQMKSWSERVASSGNMLDADLLAMFADTSEEGKLALLRFLAEKNNTEKQYDLYTALGRSHDIEDKREAEKWLLKSAQGNLVKAQFALSEKLWEKNPEQARYWLTRAAHHNHLSAMKKIAALYSSGAGGFEQDLDKSIEYYDKLLGMDVKQLDKVERDNHMFIKETVSKERDRIAALNRQLKAGNLEVKTNLAMQQINSKNTHQIDAGIKRLIDASTQGHSEAQYQLGKLYLAGDGNLKKDSNLAVEQFKLASDGGQIEAKEKLVDIYMHGKHGVDTDFDSALALSKQVAEYYLANEERNKGTFDPARLWGVKIIDIYDLRGRSRDRLYVSPRRGRLTLEELLKNMEDPSYAP